MTVTQLSISSSLHNAWQRVVTSGPHQKLWVGTSVTLTAGSFSIAQHGSFKMALTTETIALLSYALSRRESWARTASAMTATSIYVPVRLAEIGLRSITLATQVAAGSVCFAVGVAGTVACAGAGLWCLAPTVISSGLDGSAAASIKDAGFFFLSAYAGSQITPRLTAYLFSGISPAEKAKDLINNMRILPSDARRVWNRTVEAPWSKSHRIRVLQA